MTTDIMKGSDILTAQEVMDLLKVKRTTLHYWVKQGKLTSLKPAGRILFLRKEVMDFLHTDNREQ